MTDLATPGFPENPLGLPGTGDSGPSPSPQATVPTTADLAWAAGFIDGEACIHIAKQHQPGRRLPTYRLGLSIAQNDRPVLEHLCRAVGIDTPIFLTKLAPGHRRQCFTLCFSGKQAWKLLQLVLPFLVRKRREADAAIAFWTNRLAVASPWPEGRTAGVEDDVREQFFLLLKRLK